MEIKFTVPDGLFEKPMIVTSIDAENNVQAYETTFVDYPKKGNWLSEGFGFVCLGNYKLTILEKLIHIADCRRFAMKEQGVEFLFNMSDKYFGIFWRWKENQYK